MADTAEAEEYVCPNCEAPVEPEWKACPNCGIEFEGGEEEAPAPPPAAAAAAPPKPAAPPPRPAAPPATASPPKSTPAAPPAKGAAPPAKPAAPAKGEKPAKPPKGPKAAKAGRPKGNVPGPAFLKPLIGRFGIIGFVGLPVALAGLGGFFVIMNYDTILGGQRVNDIGPNQLNAMLGAVAVAGVGVFLTILGFTRARSPGASVATELDAMTAVSPAVPERAPSPWTATPAPPPAAVEVPEPEPELYPAPYAPAVAAAEAEPEPEPEAEEEEAEDDFELPPTPAPPVPAAPRAPPAPTPPAAPPSPAPPPPKAAPPPPAPAAAAAAPAERDELEDLFGELENEVAKAEEDEVHYECPNCHGIVREDDTTCPHCQVVFEG